MSTSLAIPGARNLAHFNGSRAQMRVGDGVVSGYLTLARVDRRSATATYALRIENDSPHPLAGQLQLSGSRSLLDVAPLRISVAPFSIKETLLPVRLDETGPYDRAIVEVYGEGCHLAIEAAAPPRPRGRKWLTRIAATATAVVALGFAAAISTPRIGALDAPARAIAGSSIDVPYVVGGLGHVRYDVTGDDGIRVAAGMLDARSGSLHVGVPASETLRVQIDGPLGSVSRTSHVTAVFAPRNATHAAAARIAAPARDTNAPLISDLSVAPSQIRAGSVIRVNATTRATSGEVWLVDDAGTLWAKKALNTGAATWMTIPDNAGGRELRVVVRASDGKHEAASGVGIVVAPAAKAPDAAPKHVAAAAAQAAALTLSADEVAAGEPVTAFVRGPHDDVHITLTDKSGTVLAQGDMGSGEDALSLVAPAVRGNATYYVVAAVTRGTSTESLVHPLRVTAASRP